MKHITLSLPLRGLRGALLSVVTAAVWSSSLWSQSSQPAPPRVANIAEPIKPIPVELKLDPRKVVLGGKLFHDPLLSGDNTISCASCHGLGTGGVDGRKVSTGIHGAVGEINAPTVFNSTFNFKQFWDGRAATLEEQAGGPVVNEKEMGAKWEDVLRKLRTAPGYAATFQEMFSDGIQPAHVQEVIAEFERSLVTPNARFDRFLRGTATALSAEEKAGYAKFKSYGCTSCHQGINVGGNMFETLGAVQDYFTERGHVTKADFGRFNVTGKEEDRYVFKVPSLRNVALTAPYFHDGSAPTLADAVRVMTKHQLGRSMPDEDVQLIVKFLNTLTGEYNGRPL